MQVLIDEKTSTISFSTINYIINNTTPQRFEISNFKVKQINIENNFLIKTIEIKNLLMPIYMEKILYCLEIMR